MNKIPYNHPGVNSDFVGNQPPLVRVNHIPRAVAVAYTIILAVCAVGIGVVALHASDYTLGGIAVMGIAGISAILVLAYGLTSLHPRSIPSCPPIYRRRSRLPERH